MVPPGIHAIMALASQSLPESVEKVIARCFASRVFSSNVTNNGSNGIFGLIGCGGIWRSGSVLTVIHSLDPSTLTLAL
jgi:hypothetical protein